MMASAWSTALVGDCIARVPIARKEKIQTRDYRPAGRFPIIDQGLQPIAGWTDDESAVIDTPLPLIVFGDHTRAFKFVDIPFARGADGTQLLRPLDSIDPRFFFYACRAIDLPARGYNRHFTALKEQPLAYPTDLAEQRAIAELLSRAEFVAKLQSEMLDRLGRLKHATMRELFTRGLRGEPQKETEIGLVPESWDIARLGELAKIGNGTTPNRTDPRYWSGGAIPWITSSRMYERRISGSDVLVTPTALAEASLPLLPPGTVLIAIVGEGKTLGHCAILDVEATTSRHVGFIQLRDGVLPGFLVGNLESRYQYLRQLASGNGSTRAALTGAILKGVPIPVPGIEEQRDIIAILDAVDRKIELHKRKRVTLEKLFNALLHKLMTGELRVDRLHLPTPHSAPQQRATG